MKRIVKIHDLDLIFLSSQSLTNLVVIINIPVFKSDIFFFQIRKKTANYEKIILLQRDQKLK